MALNDSMVSFATGLGMRAEQREFVAGRKLSDKTLSALYENNWLVKKYIDVRTTDMTRLDREILNDLEPEVHSRIESIQRRLGIYAKREEALSWMSLYGDSLIVAITDQENLEEPLDLLTEKIQRFIVLDKTAYDFDIKQLDDDITNPNYGKPRMYKIRMGSGDVLIHNSRVCRNEAGKRSFKEKVSHTGRFGRSDVLAIKDPLYAYLSVFTNINDIVDQSKTDVLYIDGFNMAIASGREEDFIVLAKAMNSIRGSTGAMMIDKDTSWEQKELTFTGLTDILKNSRDDVAGACDMPLTRLFGQSAAGFASGEEDNQKYYESIASLQESRLRPIDQFFDQFVIAEARLDLTHFDFIYPSIELSNETEKATILSTVTTALSTALQDGVINEVQYAKELKNRELVSSITDADIDELENYINEPEAENEDPYAQDEGSETEQAGGGVLPQAFG